MLKDLSLVSPAADQVVLVDDKPQYAFNGRTIEVSEYRELVPISALTQVLLEQVQCEAIRAKIALVIERDAEAHPIVNRPFDHESCTWLYEHVMPQLTDAFDCTHDNDLNHDNSL